MQQTPRQRIMLHPLLLLFTLFVSQVRASQLQDFTRRNPKDSCDDDRSIDTATGVCRDEGGLEPCHSNAAVDPIGQSSLLPECDDTGIIAIDPMLMEGLSVFLPGDEDEDDDDDSDFEASNCASQNDSPTETESATLTLNATEAADSQDCIWELPLAQQRTLILQELRKRFNLVAQPTKKPPLKHISWEHVEDVCGWPQKVLFYESCSWDRSDVKELWTALPQISFKVSEASLKLTSKTVANNLFQRLKRLNFAVFANEKIKWREYMKKVHPELRVLSPIPETWRLPDVLQIQALIRRLETMDDSAEPDSILVAKQQRLRLHRALLHKLQAYTGRTHCHIDWNKYEVTYWPASVVFYNYNHWSGTDVRVLAGELDRIAFQTVPKPQHQFPDDARIDLYNQLRQLVYRFLRSRSVPWSAAMKSIMPDLHLTVPNHNTWTHADLLKISQLVRVFSTLVEEKEQQKQQEQGQGQDDWLHVSVVSAVKQNVYKQLLDKANAAIGASNREINWSRVRVVRWPREVLFYSSSHWSREDLKVILRHIDSIDFEERGSVAASVADADAGAAAGTAGTVLVDATAEAATVSATAESSLSLSAASAAASATNDETIPFETRMRIINDLLDISDIVSDRVSTTRYIMWRKLKKHFPTLHLVSSESHRWCREDIRQLEALISTFKGAGMTGNKRMRNEDLPVSR